jgi:hypothetical protein
MLQARRVCVCAYVCLYPECVVLYEIIPVFSKQNLKVTDEA